MQQLLIKLFELLDQLFDLLLVFDNKYFDFFQLFQMKNHFHQQINLNSTNQIQDQYHNLPENYLHERNLNQELLFVAVMVH